MKLIEVLQKVANGEIKKGTRFTVGKRTYTFNGDMFILYQSQFGGNLLLSAHDLNREVDFIQPKPKKYYLRLDENDSFSYINRNVEYLTCKISSKSEDLVCKTKFTQEEIDNDKFLKFIEQHGIKEEVEECD